MARITEEVGELAAAATSMSKSRDRRRRQRILDEAVDVLATVIRLCAEFPDGREDSDES
ncbi:MAG: hypothetical protein AAFP22_15725 [Planctomycetota bacterium]